MRYLKQSLANLALIFLTSCASYNISEVMTPLDRQVNTKYPKMKLEFIGENTSFYSLNFFETFYFKSNILNQIYLRDFEKNIIQNEKNTKGYFLLNASVTVNENSLWGIPVGLTLGVLFLLGVPGSSFTGQATLQLSVIDNNGNIIKNYYSSAEKTSYVAIGQYTADNASQNAYTGSFKLALDDLINQLNNDTSKSLIISELNSKNRNTIVKTKSIPSISFYEIDERTELKANAELPQWLNYYLDEGIVLQGDKTYKNYIGEGKNLEDTYKSLRKQLANEFFNGDENSAKKVQCEKTVIKTYQDTTFSMFRCLYSDINKLKK